MEAAKRILIVDDEREFLFSAGVALKRAGYEVQIASNPRDAICAILRADAERHPFDLLVTDLRMPEMSGVELVGELKRRKVGMMVLAITSVREKGLLRAMDCGRGADYLQKPFGPRELVDRIGGIFSRGMPGGDFENAEYA